MENVVDILIYIIKGIVIGIVASAPMGPVGILCIRRTIKKGRAYGVVTGAGAALSDVFLCVANRLRPVVGVAVDLSCQCLLGEARWLRHALGFRSLYVPHRSARGRSPRIQE